MKRKMIRWTLMLATTMMLASAVTTATALEAPIAELPPPAPTYQSEEHLSKATCSTLERVNFELGTTSGMVSGELLAWRTDCYILRAMAGQLMEVALSAPEGIKLSVWTAGGQALTPVTGGPTGFRGYLPEDGDYIIEVRSDGEPATYSLDISIPRRISFETGATSATLEGHLRPFQSLDYILRAQAGQLLEINISPEDRVQLIIYGVDGTVLRSGMGEGSNFRGELPFSEDYIVTVRAGEQPVVFSMNVIIPERIRFWPGAISSIEQGTLSSSQTHYYVLRALEDQTMKVRVFPEEALQLIIYGADGTVLRSGMGEGAGFSGQLPSTQDYILAVRAGPNSVAYTLLVIIL